MERGQAGKRPARADCEPSLHGRGQMERKKSPAPVVFVRPFGSRATPQSANAASIPQFSMVAPLRSRARLRYSLLHWAYFALFRPQGARFVRPRRTRRRGRLKRERASVPQFGMVVPHLRTVPPLAARCSVAAHCALLRVLTTSALRAFGCSQARLRLSLPHWAYSALLRPLGARFVRPSRALPWVFF